MKIRIANENNRLFLASWGQEIEISQEEVDILATWIYTIVQEWETYKIVARDETNDELRVKYETQISQIESQMPILRTQRDWLEETITYGLEAPWDSTKLEAIKTQLVALATQRKELYEKIAELDF